MESDKLPLYEAECISKRKREPAKRNTSTAIFVLLIFLVLTIFIFLSWYNMEMFHNRNEVKPPFNPPSRDDLAKTGVVVHKYYSDLTHLFIEFAYTRYHYVNCSVYPYYNELCACRLQRTDHGPETEHFLID
ncbi:Hypothetical predicted protein [Paramuricea clavata]|uniref:Uncharacterized protein n=1 Tax=Paramuricea clavata TaxID=317549 RepID=A0A7D9IQT1_PARCT|nr:Hypothetical predicted protein [Paramuricea clavata]